MAFFLVLIIITCSNGRSFRYGRLRSQMEEIHHACLGSAPVRVVIHGRHSGDASSGGVGIVYRLGVYAANACDRQVADSALVPYTYILAFSRAFFNRERDKNLIRLDSAHQSGYSGHNDKSCSLALRSTYFVSFAATCPGLPPATRASRPPLGDACVLTVSC